MADEVTQGFPTGDARAFVGPLPAGDCFISQIQGSPAMYRNFEGGIMPTAFGTPVLGDSSVAAAGAFKPPSGWTESTTLPVLVPLSQKRRGWG